jgi:glycerophosphoryl diester phosphodiesterase
VWARRQPGQGPLVVGHRGASALEVENTTAAFARARADGADGVELDVLLCRTGEVVVFHDDDLRRLAGRPERVADLPLAALREVRLGTGQGIPTLEEAIESCGPELLVNVELKAAGLPGPAIGALVESVAKIIDHMAVGERILVSSFSPRAVGRWQRRSPAVRAALLFEGPTAIRSLPAVWLRPFALNPELRLCRPARVADWRRRGYFLSVWTVDDPADLRTCRDLGIDAVITNDPGRARAALREAETLKR